MLTTRIPHLLLCPLTAFQDLQTVVDLQRATLSQRTQHLPRLFLKATTKEEMFTGRPVLASLHLHQDLHPHRAFIPIREILILPPPLLILVQVQVQVHPQLPPLLLPKTVESENDPSFASRRNDLL